ncbi:MAG: hypothetical protein IJV67_00315, partial [Clostridia bacterium]|nr:hypothetical protein [Clostridia bacterium]
PNCKTAKMLLDKTGVVYKVIDAEEEVEVTRSYGVTNAPTLLVPNGNGYDVFDNISKVKKYTETVRN